MDIINNNYNELSKNVEEYNKIRRELSEKLNDFMYDKYPKEKERIMMRFSDEWKEMREKRINKEK